MENDFRTMISYYIIELSYGRHGPLKLYLKSVFFLLLILFAKIIFPRKNPSHNF